jgi:glycosyltransferase involved in cell wall biosynthesis
MRIALVVHRFPPGSLAGTEVYVRNLARTLAKRHEVFVFYRDDRDGTTFYEEHKEREGYQTWVVGRKTIQEQLNPVAPFRDTLFNPDVEAAFERFLDETEPDLVHFHHVMWLSYRLIAHAKRRGLPTLLTLHDYWFICPNSQLIWPDGQICRGNKLGLNCTHCLTAHSEKAWVKRIRPAILPVVWLRDALVRRAALTADRLIAPSRFLISKYAEEGFASERFQWLENGIDVARIRGFERQPAGDRLRVTYLGTLAWHKGVDVLVRAASTLSPEGFRLRVFGSLDNIFPEYVARLREAANSAHTTFDGRLPNDLVGKVLAETDVLAVPSIWYENSPVVIQEAFAAGVPVMASRVGAMTEKIDHERDGLLVAPGDVDAWRAALERLLDEEGLLEQLQAGITPVLTNQEHVEKIERIYQETIAAPSNSPEMEKTDEEV